MVLKLSEYVLNNESSIKIRKEDVYGQEEMNVCIFETYYKRVYNYIYYRVNNHHTSEDLVSITFEKVITKMDTYSEKKAPFEVWLFAIAKNTVNDYCRKYKTQKLISIDLFKELISKRKTPEEIILTAEINDKLLKALDILSPRERNIVALKFGGNLKNKEIAKLLNLTESNIGVILYRLMKKLKDKIEREESV